MKTKKLKKLNKDIELARVSETLQALTGLSLEDIICQACALTHEYAAYWELKNITKMDNYLKSEKKEIH